MVFKSICTCFTNTVIFKCFALGAFLYLHEMGFTIKY